MNALRKKITPNNSDDFKEIIGYFNNFTQNTNDTEVISYLTAFIDYLKISCILLESSSNFRN